MLWVGIVGLALVQAAVPQLTSVKISTNVSGILETSPVPIPNTYLPIYVIIKGTSDVPLTTGILQIRLPDGTVVAQRSYKYNASLTYFGFGLYSDSTVANGYILSDSFVFPKDTQVTKVGTDTWSVVGSLTNAQGTTDTSQSTNAGLKTTFSVEVKTASDDPSLAYSTSQCEVTNPFPCPPGNVIAISAAAAVSQEVKLRSTAPATIKAASSSLVIKTTKISVTGAIPASSCHTLESLTIITDSTLTLDAYYSLCLVNTVINQLDTWTSSPRIVGSGSSKIVIASAVTSPASATEVNAYVAVSDGATLTIGGDFTLTGAGKIGVNGGGILQLNANLTCRLTSSASTCLELLGNGGSLKAASVLAVNVGVVRINGKSWTDTAIGVIVGTNPPATQAHKAGVAELSTQIGGPSASFAIAPYTLGTNTLTCGANDNGHNTFGMLTLNPTGALFVSQKCTATNVTTVSNELINTTVAAKGDTLIFNGGKLIFLDVKKDGPILSLNNTYNIKGSIEVQLTSENMPADAFRIYLMQFSYPACKDFTLAATIVNAPAGRTPIMQGCALSASGSFFYITIPAATNAAPTNQTQARPYSSQNKYFITLGRECGTVTETSFRSDVASQGIDADAIADFTLTCGSVIATFTCRDSSSSANADATCQSILGAANGNLRSSWNTQSTSYVPLQQGSASNTGLYALFVLVLIPIFCIFCICLIVRNKKRRADNQYKQDTATFANVASSPQPINYPYPYAAEGQTVPYGYADVAKPYELQPVTGQAPYGY